MEYSYPATKGAGPWGVGRSPSMLYPGGYPASAGTWPYPMATGGYSGYPAQPPGYSPGYLPQTPGYLPQTPLSQTPGYLPQTLGYPAQKAGYPAPWSAGPAAPYGLPPAHLSEMLPAVSAYEPREGSMILDLSAYIVPALDSLVPAIFGLLQIPSRLMERESAGLLSRWDDFLVTLTPESEAFAEEPAEKAAGDMPPKTET